MTVYLKFANQSEAVKALESAGFVIDRDMFTGKGWGWHGAIEATNGYHANLYDSECPATLTTYKVAAPATPYNVRWGE
jgi:hypothetical protein